ncbi:MAG TPA: class I SAM-dependent methyltransferase [Nitrospiraceae bacterium]|nr:class I SAM-dependent methyltransferase [Nitrospiraceae bacterium]
MIASHAMQPSLGPQDTAYAVGSCRFCHTPLTRTFIDLGASPLANSYLKPEHVARMEPFYPLHVYVCTTCLLVQLPDAESPEHIFTDYAYFSSYSPAWLQHAKTYTRMIAARLALGADSKVIEVASNDGYLLQYFLDQDIPVLGIEPAVNVAQAALQRGVPTMTRFFGRAVADELVAAGHRADLLIGNNVLAHVPDLADFLTGIKTVLKPNGVVTMEFPHLLRLMADNQFDTIYHEHLSYFSFTTVSRIFEFYGLTVFDVDELPTHGGSLRVYAGHAEDGSKSVSRNVDALLSKEAEAELTDLKGYTGFAARVHETKSRLLEFLITAKRQGKSIVGYGAPAKGNTLLNFCSIRTDFLDYTVDASPHKQGQFLPGTHIPISAPDRIHMTHPDYVLILPWNLKEEIMHQMDGIRQWGGQFVIPIPHVQVC